MTIIFIGVIGFGASFFKAHIEAKAYNKLCQPIRPATAWDAMFVRLRVDSCNIKNITN